MRRLNLFLAVLVWLVVLLAGCDRPVPDATPTPIVTVAPTEAVDPTPTRELVLDCRDLTYHPDFAPVNANPCLLGGFTIVEEVPTSDGRYQAVPNGLYVVIEFADRPGYTSRRVPPFINERSDPNRYGPLQRGYRVEINQVDGRFGYGLPGVFLRGTAADPQRYILKLGAVTNLTGLPRSTDVQIGGRLIFDTGAIMELPPQAIRDVSGQVEYIYVIENTEHLVTVDVQLWIDVRFASCETANGACFFTIQQVAVLTAPDDFGDDVVIAVP